jgi:hypothetical protein
VLLSYCLSILQFLHFSCSCYPTNVRVGLKGLFSFPFLGVLIRFKVEESRDSHILIYLFFFRGLNRVKVSRDGHAPTCALFNGRY